LPSAEDVNCFAFASAPLLAIGTLAQPVISKTAVNTTAAIHLRIMSLPLFLCDSNTWFAHHNQIMGNKEECGLHR
jgi:hypothetical protein